jgi:beta-glucosidase
VASNLADAARQALAARVDFDVADTPAYNRLVDQVKRGTVPMTEVNRAVGRVLEAKFRPALFDHPDVDADYAERVNKSPKHRPTTAVTSSPRASRCSPSDRG